MVDEFRSIRENIIRAVINNGNDTDRDEDAAQSIASIKAILGSLTAKAGKGKDDLVQIIARETGTAIAAMLREPLNELAKNQKLQITFEFVPKDEKKESASARKPTQVKKSRKKKKATKRR